MLKREYQVGVAIAVASQLIAWGLFNHTDPRFIATSVILYIVLIYGFSFLVVALSQGQHDRAEQRAKVEVDRLLSLSTTEAKQKALTLLSDSTRFKCVLNPAGDCAKVSGLGPILTDFFSQFSSVREANGEFEVNRTSIRDSQIRVGFVKIGNEFEGAELVVRPGDDQVFIVHDEKHVLDGSPTIYHHILLLA